MTKVKAATEARAYEYLRASRGIIARQELETDFFPVLMTGADRPLRSVDRCSRDPQLGVLRQKRWVFRVTKIIESLREEHRSIEEVLLVLEHELNIFSRGDRPDYEIINAVISYLLDYPDCCHHPKEDMIFEKLKARNSLAAESVGDLEAEHRNEGKRLRQVSDMIRGILTHEEAPGQTFDNVMRDFVAQERSHMKMEERVLFSSAVAALRPEDWAVIEARWSETEDSLFNVAIEEKCESIRERILQWQLENRENRITPHADSLAKSRH